MQEKKVDVIMFEGGESPASWPESLLLQVRLEASKEQLSTFLSIKEINRVILVSDYKELINFTRQHPDFGNKLFLKNSTPGNFHYGKVLKELIDEWGLKKVMVCGGGSTPLLSKEEINAICHRLIDSGEAPFLYANNPQSGDIVAFTPANSINEMELPGSDNALVMGLRYEVGLPFYLIPFSPGIIFDLDTPSELFFLLDQPKKSDRISELISELDPEKKEVLNQGWERFMNLKEVMSGYYEDVILVGRVSGSMMTHINENIKCRLRVFSEERGMKAMGRVDKLKVKSFLGYFLEEAGIERFFDHLRSLGQACIIDSRVIFHHFGAGRFTADRFYSDLFVPDEIEDDFVKEFTVQAKKVDIPVLMGGHSLVSGGLYALVEQIKQKHGQKR